MAKSDATFGVINVDVWTATYPHEKSQIDIENVFDSSNIVFKLRIYGHMPFDEEEKKLIHLCAHTNATDCGAEVLVDENK